MKRPSLYLALLLLLTCAKEDSQSPNNPPSQIIKQYTITPSAGEGGSVSGGGTFDSGSKVTITAIASSGYIFSNWSDGNLLIERIITIDSDTELEALFEIDCVYWQYEVPDWKKTSYELFDIIYPEKYLQVGSLLNNQWGNESGEYGFNVIVVDYNNDGYRDVIGFYNDYSNFVAYPQDYLGYERKKND